MGSRKVVVRKPPPERHSPAMQAKIDAARRLTADSPSVKRGAANLMRAARAGR